MKSNIKLLIISVSENQQIRPEAIQEHRRPQTSSTWLYICFCLQGKERMYLKRNQGWKKIEICLYMPHLGEGKITLQCAFRKYFLHSLSLTERYKIEPFCVQTLHPTVSQGFAVIIYLACISVDVRNYHYPSLGLGTVTGGRFQHLP